MLSKETLQSTLDQAVEIVEASTQIIHEMMQAGFSHQMKADNSPVTEIDMAVERFIRSELERRFPEYGILGEEYGGSATAGDYRWTVDPIDGTISLRHGLPLFGTILGLWFDEAPILGVISLPMLSQVCYGAKGLGTYLNGKRVQLADVSPDGVTDQVIATGDRRQFVAAGKPQLFDRLFSSHPCVRTYPDVSGHIFALQGAVGAMVDFDLRPWDAGATKVLIEEAGGRYELVNIRSAGGEPRYDVIFGKPQVVDWIVREMKRAGVL